MLTQGACGSHILGSEPVLSGPVHSLGLDGEAPVRRGGDPTNEGHSADKGTLEWSSC